MNLNFFSEFFSNKMLVSALVAWFIAQLLKVIFVLLKDKKFDVRRFVGSGGMPSSHSAFVLALATSVGYETGLRSAAFAICVVLAFVVMYDASGIRRAAGEQAEILNKIIENFGNENLEVTGKRLKELLGHTPFEVFAGALVGILVSVLYYAF